VLFQGLWCTTISPAILRRCTVPEVLRDTIIKKLAIPRGNKSDHDDIPLPCALKTAVFMCVHGLQLLYWVGATFIKVSALNSSYFPLPFGRAF